MSDPVEPLKPEITGDSQGRANLFVRGRDLAAQSPVVDPDDEQIERRFGAGRPRGSRNIASKKRLELFQRIAGDPLLQSARLLAMPLDDLAAMLGCTRVEAAKFQQAERALALPYVASKRPVEMEVKTTATKLTLSLGSTLSPIPLPAGGVVALLEQAAEGAALVLGANADDLEENAEKTGG
jgi:hypothetical protein